MSILSSVGSGKKYILEQKVNKVKQVIDKAFNWTSRIEVVGDEEDYKPVALVWPQTENGSITVYGNMLPCEVFFRGRPKLCFSNFSELAHYKKIGNLFGKQADLYDFEFVNCIFKENKRCHFPMSYVFSFTDKIKSSKIYFDYIHMCTEEGIYYDTPIVDENYFSGIRRTDTIKLLKNLLFENNEVYIPLLGSHDRYKKLSMVELDRYRLLIQERIKNKEQQLDKRVEAKWGFNTKQSCQS